MNLRLVVSAIAMLMAPYITLGQQSGGLPALQTDLTNEALARQRADARHDAAIEALAARVDALEAALAELRGPDLDTACWTQVYAHNLASQPPGSMLANGAFQGQGPATRYGRDCWVQDSDWNQLFVSAPQDATFALEADVYIPAPIPYNRGAAFLLFVDRTGHGMQVSLVPGTGGTGVVEWWTISSSGAYSDVRSTPSPFSFDQWHRFRVEGSRSKCELRVKLDGTVIDSWQGGCDLSGALHALVSGGVSSTTAAEVGWSNLRIEKGVLCER